MLLVGLLATLSVALAAEDIITVPSPGNEYVSLVTGSHNHHARKIAHHDMRVSVKDEGKTGLKHSDKPYPTKKADGLSGKKEQASPVKASVKDEGATGAVRKEGTGTLGVPQHKHISFPSRPEKTLTDESPDFDDDGSIVPAASSQTSRINVKKGPNGQEYEYEYVYYYYDDDEEGGAKAGAKAGASKAGGESVKGETTSAAPAVPRGKSVEEEIKIRQQVDEEEAVRTDDEGETRTEELRQDDRQGLRDEGVRQEERRRAQEEIKYQLEREEAIPPIRFDTRQQKEERTQDHAAGLAGRGRGGTRQPQTQPDTTEEPVRQRGRGDSHRHHFNRQQDAAEEDARGERHRVAEQQERHVQEEERRRRPVQQAAAVPEEPSSRTRYASIERGRGSAHSLTTAEPSTNEVLPTRAPHRSRGQPVVQAGAEEEDRQSGRFPSRSRGSAQVAAPVEQPARSRGSSQPQQGGERSGGSVRRPSLVDSSSFRTHGSAEPGPGEEELGGYLSQQLYNTRESDLEEYVRPTTFQAPVQQPAVTTLPPQLAQTPPDQMPEKAALDLYAILQQTQEENSVLDPEYKTTDLPVVVTTTPEATTTPEPTTTPTTTTTTTTTTTAAPPPSQPQQRPRFRGTGAGRSRLRAGNAATSTTTEAAQAPAEEEVTRKAFRPSHNRNPGQVSAYGRRRGQAASSTSAPSTEAPQSSSRAPRPAFQANGNGNRYRTRGRISTTLAPGSGSEEDKRSEEVASTTTSRPVRARITATPQARPLRPGPRLNLRPGRPSSTQPPAGEEAVEEEAGPAPTSPAPQQHQQQPQQQEGEQPQHAEGDSLSRLRSRPRLKVQQPAAPQPRPFNPVRRPLPGLRRRTTESESEGEAATTPANSSAGGSGEAPDTEAPAQQAPASTEAPAPAQATEGKLSSLISRRRPLPRRLQPRPQPQPEA